LLRGEHVREYVPFREVTGPATGVVVAGAWAGVKEQMADRYAVEPPGEAMRRRRSTSHRRATVHGAPLWTLGGDHRREPARTGDRRLIDTVVMTAIWATVTMTSGAGGRLTMTPSAPTSQAASSPSAARGGSPVVLGAALLGFFLISLDALIVPVALPDIGRSLGGGMSGLQWVVDGYMLTFAALMVAAGSLSDRIGARRAFGGGLVLFAWVSAACGSRPGSACWSPPGSCRGPRRR
jgi:hypothetical protein